jgi:hypothetical protein
MVPDWIARVYAHRDLERLSHPQRQKVTESAVP